MNKKQSFEIVGLAGKKTLKGAIKINGAKNAALKAMAASVLFDGPVNLENIPDNDDVHKMVEILRKIGAKISWHENSNSLEIDPRSITSTDINSDLAGAMRASVVLTGPILARFGKVSFPAPGGCVIGARPIDLFIDGYAKMDATTNEENCTYTIESKGRLTGAHIVFPKISVGATETLLMAAVLANGTTILENCALEPEIGNVADWLNECGAKINGIGTSKLTIIGRNGKLLSPADPYVAIPDRIEAGSFLLLGALCASDLTLTDCKPDHLESLVMLLKDSGVPIRTDINNIYIEGNTKKNETLRRFDVKTREFPGFPTDLQAQVVVYLSQVTGKSVVEENIFEGRFKYVEDLVKMGANIKSINPRTIEVSGPQALHELTTEEELNAHDIRAGFAVIMAALVGIGKFKINNVHLIDRGYERLEDKLSNIGADVKRLES